MKIIANHAHLMPENSWRPGDADLLLRYLDFCGIEKTVVFPPFACQFQHDMEKTRQAIEVFRGLDLPETDKEKLLGGNLVKLLGLSYGGVST